MMPTEFMTVSWSLNIWEYLSPHHSGIQHTQILVEQLNILSYPKLIVEQIILNLLRQYII